MDRSELIAKLNELVTRYGFVAVLEEVGEIAGSQGEYLSDSYSLSSAWARVQGKVETAAECAALHFGATK